MPFQPSRLLLAILLLAGLGARPARGQDIDLAEIFGNDRFYKQNGILQSGGDVRFVADVWLLPGAADSSVAMVGVSLSNSALQFVRTSNGAWQADYQVTLTVERSAGGVVLERSWDKNVPVGTFDETLLTGETIVFQAEVPLPPGEHEARITVRDKNADHASRVTTELKVPGVAERPTLAGPILLRRHEGDQFIVSPSHYFASAPKAFDYLVEVADADSTAGPYTLSAGVFSTSNPADTTGTTTQELAPGVDGRTRAFGSIPNAGARFGEYTLETTLTDGSGRQVAAGHTALLVSGSGSWIVDNWSKALSLIKYEATSKEMDILEDIDDPQKRLEAWSCFWRIRDPVPATSENEALQEYFRRIDVANRTWSSTLRKGYQSDRGRVYITLGPPDEIIERPVPSGQVPYEVWQYYNYNFEIVFADRIGFNNYQIENTGTYQSELGSIERRKRKFLKERADQCPLLAPAFD